MSQKKIPQSPPRSALPTVRSSVPKHSPFLEKKLDGMLRYHHSVGEPEDKPTSTPEGTEKKRQRYEGPSHGYLKVEGKSYSSAMPIRTPEEAYYSSLSALMDIEKRFLEDKAIHQRKRAVEERHFYYSVKSMEKTLDNLLKVYLSCTNPKEFIAGLNWYIQANQFLNPFSLHALYRNSDKESFNHSLIGTTGRAEVTSSDFESILIDQLTRLKEEADTDYTVYQAGDDEFKDRSKKTTKFASSCTKKIAEFCRLFAEEERSAFLERLNQQFADGNFYNPAKLVLLYGDASMPYDIAKAQDKIFCYQPIAWARDLSTVPLRSTFRCPPPSSMLDAIRAEEVVSKKRTFKRTKRTTDARGVVTETTIEKTTQTITKRHSIFSLSAPVSSNTVLEQNAYDSDYCSDDGSPCTP